MRLVRSNSWVEVGHDMPESEECRIVDGKQLDKFHQAFRAEEKNVVAMNAICNVEMNTVLQNRDLTLDTYHIFSTRLEPEGKATNQKSSGRCWLFAAMNVLRLELMKKYNLEDFEFSQAYQMWFDKLEKSNWFLENVIKTADEDLESRIVKFLLQGPVQDGGQWDMAVSLIQKYGLVPKGAFPESTQSSNTNQMVWLLTVKLREYARKLRAMKKEGATNHTLQEEKTKMLAEVYKILAITLGEPPKSFDWNFRDKDKKFTSITGLTPQAFFKEHVEPNGCALDQMVSIVHDPRNDYYQLYTVEYLGNVLEGRPVLYINLPVEELKRVAVAAIGEGRPVWFGCDVGKFCNRQKGIMDLEQFDYKRAYGIEFGLDKAERLDYGESIMTHAMSLTGVHLEKEKPVRWRIENSWGDENGDKGYFCMTDDWFGEYVFQVVVDIKHLTAEQKKVLDQTPKRLPPWDPLGSLA